MAVWPVAAAYSHTIYTSPAVHALDVLSEQHAAQLRERVRLGIVERPEDAFAIGNRQRENDRAQRDAPL